MSLPTLIEADIAGRIGVTLNKYGTPTSLHVCDTCGLLFTVCPPATNREWRTSCLAEECESYDVTRDVDLMFEIEPWRIERDTPPGDTNGH